MLGMWKQGNRKRAVEHSFYFCLEVIYIQNELENTVGAVTTLFSMKEWQLLFRLYKALKKPFPDLMQRLIGAGKNKPAVDLIKFASLSFDDYPELTQFRVNQFVWGAHITNSNPVPLLQMAEICGRNPENMATLITSYSQASQKNIDSWMLERAAQLLHQFPSAMEYLQGHVKNRLSKFPRRTTLGINQEYSPLQPEREFQMWIPLENVIFVDTPELVETLQWNEPVVGLDCEDSTCFPPGELQILSTMQIGFRNHVFIIDFIALNQNEALDGKLTELFQSDVVKLGIAFQGDFKMIKKSYPHMQCTKLPMKRYADLLTVFTKCTGKNAGGLMGLSAQLLCTPMCKTEQRSNWLQRPLRLSQIHYAALDAYIELLLWDKLVEKYQTATESIDSFIQAATKVTTTSKEKVCPYCCGFHADVKCAFSHRCRVCNRYSHSGEECSY